MSKREQKETLSVSHLLRRKDGLVVLATGFGKSYIPCISKFRFGEGNG